MANTPKPKGQNMYWKSELETRLTYLDVPQKYRPGLKEFISQLLSDSKREWVEKIRGLLVT